MTKKEKKELGRLARIWQNGVASPEMIRRCKQLIRKAAVTTAQE